MAKDTVLWAESMPGTLWMVARPCRIEKQPDGELRMRKSWDGVYKPESLKGTFVIETGRCARSYLDGSGRDPFDLKFVVAIVDGLKVLIDCKDDLLQWVQGPGGTSGAEEEH